jgi:hypothetical protein
VPRGRNADDRLAKLERWLDALETREASLPERREYTHEEIVEIGLILLAYIYEGDVGAYAQYLVKEGGMPVREAEELAGTIAHLLEERRKTAVNPGHPV